MSALMDLPNIGKYAAEQLRLVGIETAEQLVDEGAERAWLRIRAIDPGACLHLLYGLAGAVEGVPKSTLAPERKAELKAFFDAEQ